MKIFTCNDFKGHYPVGSAAVIVANNKTDAFIMLLERLLEYGLIQDEVNPPTLTEIDPLERGVTILDDGNY